MARPSVRLSVTWVDQLKTAKVRVVKFSAYSRDGELRPNYSAELFGSATLCYSTKLNFGTIRRRFSATYNVYNVVHNNFSLLFF